MTIDSINAPLEWLPTVIALGITAVIVVVGLFTFAVDVLSISDRQFPGQVYGTLIVIGIFSGATAIALYTGASAAVVKAENANFQNGLKSTYGVTSTATVRQAENGESVVVSGARGNELVTLRKTTDQLLVFRPDGTELPRVAQ